MLISRQWLESLLMPGRAPLPDDEGLAAVITGLGLEVEGVQRYGEGLEAIVVGEVRGKRAHPQADKLGLVEVFDGTGTQEVVCGARNVPEVGGRIAFAPEGTVLPGGLTIAARKIRGVVSCGMICSEVELEIGSDGDGIMVLPASWSPGDRLIDRVPGIVDTVFELSVTPNRPDALGHIGVARDLAAKLGCTVAVPPLSAPEAAEDASLVTLSAPERCGRYFGYAFEGARVGTSPLWLRVRLHRVGLRPINDVVDITNYVLLEWGQPLHAFDRDKLEEGRVVVRTAADGEPMTALDGTALTLTADDLVIADATQPAALAGIMGGADSGVGAGTTRLLLEAAWFDPKGTRRTARRHQIASDSSYRFERGVDHGAGLDRAVARAAGLIAELTGARLVAGCHARGTTPSIPAIRFRPARAAQLLGMTVPDEEAARILGALEVDVDRADPQTWRCEPPTHRPDLAIEEDLIEEIMRHHGLSALPAVPAMPTAYTQRAPTALRSPTGGCTRQDTDALLDAFVATGCHEHVGFAFADPQTLAAVDPASEAEAVRVKNPMRSGHAVLRTSLLPGLLDALALNMARHGRPLRLVELGRVYRWAAPPSGEGPTAATDRRLPTERVRATVLLSGGVPLVGSDAEVRVQDAAGVVLDALARWGVRGTVRPATDSPTPAVHPGVRATLHVATPDGGTVVVGQVGAVHPDLLRRWDLPKGVTAFFADVAVDALPARVPPLMTALPRFPATSRDLSLDADQGLPAWSIVAALRSAAADMPAETEDPPRLARGDRTDTDIEVLEDYRGTGVADGRRALLFRLHYRAEARSVEDTEVQTLHDAIVEAALSSLGEHDAAIARR